MSDLEKKLFDNIKKKLTNLKLKELKTLSFRLSKKYKQKGHKFFSSDEERLAYITCRMPAIFQALLFVLKEIKKTFSNIRIKNVLDLGSGPATVAWAMFFVFDNIEKIHLVEKDSIIDLGKDLVKDQNFFQNLVFERNDISKIKDYDFDIVCLSYVASELPNFRIEKIIKKWINSRSKIIIFLEPGTMYGFKKIKYIRQKLIDLKAKTVAPCPNTLKCPMPNDDWCHFYVRVKRTKQHKYLKAGLLPFEDEKFSYVIATKENVSNHYARVLRRPVINKSEIILTLCSNGKMKEKKILRKDKRYKDLKNIKWGDRFNV